MTVVRKPLSSGQPELFLSFLASLFWHFSPLTSSQRFRSVIRSCCLDTLSVNDGAPEDIVVFRGFCVFDFLLIGARATFDVFFPLSSNQIKSNQITFIVHITTAQVPWWVKFLRACSKQCKKQKQFTYGQYIFTDGTEDNVQNTHTHTQYTQCTIKTGLSTIHYVHIYIMYTSKHCSMLRCNRL